VTRHIHVVGAGLTGLAAAVRLSETPGVRITLSEATGRAGGRCWSFHDPLLDRTIDNGSHLVLSGNRAVLAFSRRIGGADRLQILPDAAFPFVDLATGARWQVRVPGLRSRPALPPGTRAADLADLARLLVARGGTVAGAVRRRGALWQRLWVPLTVAVLNAPPETASAALLRAVLCETALRGARACRPVVAPGGLSPALVDPAVNLLRTRGVKLRFRHSLTAVEVRDGAASALRFGAGPPEPIGHGDAVLLALPPRALAPLLPRWPAPESGHAILNAHFRVDAALAELLPPITGLIGGAAQWIFRRGDVLSVTVSAAEAAFPEGSGADETLALLWRDVACAAGAISARPLATRLLRERWATSASSAASSPVRNLILAGDHLCPGLPATLEAAVRSGAAGASSALAYLADRER
jgi:phytoene dehydrogenase-like protein